MWSFNKMAMSTNCWKYLALVYNVLFAMSALGLFVVSGILLYRLFVYRHFIGVAVELPAILLAVVGILSCSVAWMGWKSSWSMHRFHVIMFGVLLLLVVVIEFSCFVWSMVVWEKLDLDVKHAIDLYFALATTEKDEYAISRWDRVQYQLQCCGVGGPSDYSTVRTMPYSCCGQGPLQVGAAPYAADCSAVYQRGCAKPLYEHARTQVFQVAMAALGASILQSCGVFFAFYLANSIRERRISVRNRVSIVQAGADESLLSNSSAPPKY